MVQELEYIYQPWQNCFSCLKLSICHISVQEDTCHFLLSLSGKRPFWFSTRKLYLAVQHLASSFCCTFGRLTVACRGMRDSPFATLYKVGYVVSACCIVFHISECSFVHEEFPQLAWSTWWWNFFTWILFFVFIGQVIAYQTRKWEEAFGLMTFLSTESVVAGQECEGNLLTYLISSKNIIFIFF